MYEVKFNGYFTVLNASNEDEAKEVFKDYFSEEFPEIDIDMILEVNKV